MKDSTGVCNCRERYPVLQISRSLDFHKSTNFRRKVQFVSLAVQVNQGAILRFDCALYVAGSNHWSGAVRASRSQTSPNNPIF